MSSTQLKVTLSPNLMDLIYAKAQELGLSLSAYVRHLVIEDVRHQSIPEFPMSQKTEQTALQALEDYRRGKLKKVDTIDELFA